MAKFTRILSIDGGGVRGLIPAKILIYVEQKLQEKTGNPQAKLAEYFDLLAGSSAGGILTSLYLCPDPNSPTKPMLSAEEVLQFYYEKSDQIFAKSFLHSLLNFGGFLNEKYSHYSFEKLLATFFGDLRLSQLLKPSLITAYEIEQRKAHFFTQHDARLDSRYDFLVRDVVRSTSAAPTFFEVAQIRSLKNEVYTFVDGGVFANNPALCAYAEVRHKFNRYFNLDERYESGPTANEMVILSLGTGDVKRIYPYNKARNWGKIEWLIPLFDIIMTGVSETVDYQMKQIYDAIEKHSQYLRISPVLKGQDIFPIDNTSDVNLRSIVKLGQEQTEKYQNRLDDFIDLLLM
ncbi:patatin-like phospholipase family protein [Limnoraphis robusta]|uniref:Patatin-like phospholipase family protein n=1 Tax=Limnoraphis robusta CCNP1315 TaxID=3110306 RepID=A0ABU5TSD2_9CYAN|nr:patatin-like phospholipase family protein [Limnoraphis robusta]MEA5498504.1 patatin-like phospholipase family protein [Limnoraphis robusta BA-68 BA1]MEA5517473.1 patatin-like phospholipase family protein [Limnoraphis robusta CCNP1315]MEA5548955.1 patatin-like phospholipase family protein [Limnoraphis robusta CCNP1324]